MRRRSLLCLVVVSALLLGAVSAVANPIPPVVGVNSAFTAGRMAGAVLQPSTEAA